MKKRRISTSIIALLTICSLWSWPLAAQTQTKTDPPPKQPLFQGAYVGVDVFGLANRVLGSDLTSSEASLEVNLQNKYFPVIEVGYGLTDTTNDETDIHFKTSAPYFRIGAGYNVFHKKPHLPGQFIVGVRYGYSTFSYDVDAPDMTDPVWENVTLPVIYQGVKSNASWLEWVASLKTQVYKNLYLSLSARYRSMLNVKKTENSEPWYIPGFGKNKDTNIGITYSIIYKLPFQ